MISSSAAGPSFCMLPSQEIFSPGQNVVKTKLDFFLLSAQECNIPNQSMLEKKLAIDYYNQRKNIISSWKCHKAIKSQGLLYPLYVLCCFVFVYCVCQPKLVVNICINWLPIFVNFSVILGSQCSILYLFLIMYLFN